MSLWADYITELRGGTCKFIEHEWGFISYSLPGGNASVFVEDIYVVPEARGGAKRAYELLNEVSRIGLEAGRTDLTFVVRTDSPGAALNLRIYLAMGFLPCAAESGNIWLKRVITKGE